MGPVRAVVLLAMAGVGVAACGPSFQAVYECDVRFEHCYALDQAAASVDAKKQCWREWLHGYTYGQSRDRVEYAATRFSELSLDTTLPREERERPIRAHMAVPAPTNAFAPPPHLAEHPAVAGAGAGEAAQAGPTPHAVNARAPGEECAETCATYWTSCHQTCKAAACEQCDRAYRMCVPACFPGPRR